MSAAETTLEGALMALLAADADVRVLAGDPARIGRPGGGLAAYPYLEIRRHEVRPLDADEAPANEHTVELAVLSRNDGGEGARAGLAAVRAAVGAGEMQPAPWRCVLASVVGGAVAPERDGVWVATVRVRAILEPG